MKKLAFLVLFYWLGASLALAALRADELLLIVNKNSPAGQELAAFYAQSRAVPENRIVALDLPVTDEISFDQYERHVVPVVREYLSKNDLTQTVRCLVTFYGVPLRIGAHVATMPERDEARQLQKDLAQVKPQSVDLVQGLEALAAEQDKSFGPTSGADDVDALSQRIEAAMRAVIKVLNATQDRAKVQIVSDKIKGRLGKLFGKAVQLENQARAATALQQGDAREQLDKLKQQESELQKRRFDPEARKQLRELNKEWRGLIGVQRALTQQLDYLIADETMAAVDNELALLLWPAYPRGRWMGNALHWRVTGKPPFATLMVMRLDAPSPEIVHKLIESGIAVEKDGLKGLIVIDAGGAKKLDPTLKNPGYWAFEKSLNALHNLVQEKTRLICIYDDAPAVLPPQAARDVALYCGWYQLRNYQPSCIFNPGAVGYHVASYELVSLHNAGELGWVRGLLNDGIAASVGPVSEPYLHTFPPPDEFFPLLMTGRRTLAEVYWKTTPVTSWMMTMIGDPLYTPYKNAPAIKVEDLPVKLRGAVK